MRRGGRRVCFCAARPAGPRKVNAIMKYRKLGASGVKVSELCLGAMTFGEADEKSFMHKVGAEREDLVRHPESRAGAWAWNFVDTADVYGQDGLSKRDHRRLDRGAIERRKEIVLATKFGFTHG